MVRAPKRRFAFVAAGAVLAALVPAAGASAATLQIRAPSEVDHGQKFRVVTKGDARAQKDYFLSLIYHNDDQGSCGATVRDEVFGKSEYYVIFYQYPVTTDGDGEFSLRSRRIFGGIVVTGKFCAYLVNSASASKATAVRSIAFT
jgi:hypothetical protein